MGFSLEDCVSAGDTMGDVAMLDSGIFFICVANSSPDLIDEFQIRSKSSPEMCFMSSQPTAAGVIEGLRQFRLTRGEKSHKQERFLRKSDRRDLLGPALRA
jgi:hydroxymethylpyrimidine pyrophosphatase-like HAD family hydrolase